MLTTIFPSHGYPLKALADCHNGYMLWKRVNVGPPPKGVRGEEFFQVDLSRAQPENFGITILYQLGDAWE